MDAFAALRAAGALVLVLGIILGLTWLLRRYGGKLGVHAGLAPSDLRVIEWKTLDVRRKLAVVRWDGRDHLLVLGPSGDCVVAQRNAPAPPAAPAPKGDGPTVPDIAGSKIVGPGIIGETP